MTRKLKIIALSSLVVATGFFISSNWVEAYDYHIIDSATTWSKAQSPIIIDKDIWVKAGAVLTIEPGVVVKLRKNQYFINNGAVVASGTPAEQIVFTSIKDDEHGGDSNNDGTSTLPSSMDWYQVTDSGTLSFDNVKILFGGGYNGAHYPVLNIYNNGRADIVNSIISRNGSGVTVSKGMINIHNSSFFGNLDTYAGKAFDAGINIGSQGSADATSNWWGTSTGPCPFMELAPPGTNPFAYLPQCNGWPAIYKNVKYIPWLTEEPKQEELEPVVIVPGIGGSLNMNLFFAEKESEKWRFTTHDYDGLVKAFEAAGYEKEKNLFIAFYDWRKPNAFSAEKYLKPIIDKAKEASGSKKVDVIAHSMGGLVARNYIQSDGYEDDIDDFIMLGTPNHGSSDSYLLWNKAQLPEDWGKILKGAVRLFLWFKVAVSDNTSKSLDVIRKDVITVRELLPTYAYIKNKEIDQIVENSAMNTININDVLENLNNEIGLARLSEKIDTTIISGSGQDTINIIPTVDPSEKEEAVGYWLDGRPDPETPLKDSTEGDNRVLTSSATLPDIKTILIDSEHDKLPDKAQEEIFDILDEKKPDGDYVSPEIINQLGFWFASPVDVKIIAPDGTFVTRDENFISEARYDGVDDPLGFKMVTVENAQAGEYRVELTGIGEGGEYHAATAFFGEGKDVIKDTAGMINPGQVIIYDVTVGADGSVEVATKDLQPEYLLDRLIRYINTSYNKGLIDSNGIKTSLLAHLEIAKDKFSNLEGADEKEYNKNRGLGIEELKQFIKKVAKYGNKFIYGEVVDYLTEKANFVIVNI